jgi:hypothetical protein
MVAFLPNITIYISNETNSSLITAMGVTAILIDSSSLKNEH